MKPTELRNQPTKTLEKLLNEKRTELSASVTSLRTREVKNVREIRTLKRDIARIMTIMAEVKPTGEAK